jgi:hypothetical protein
MTDPKQSQSKDTLTPLDEARELATSTGHAFHCRVNEFLIKHGWSTVISPFYVDSMTDKVRESDLIAEKVFKHQAQSNDQDIRIRLFIECKYVRETSLFWFDKKDEVEVKKLLDRRTPFRSDNTFQKEHHYLSALLEVARLFQTKGRGEEGDPIFKAVNQTLHGYIYNAEHPFLVNPPQSDKRLNWPTSTLNYPVIVFSTFATFFRTGVDNVDVKKLESNFQFEVRYAYTHPALGQRARDFFLIDMVKFDGLADFLKSLEHEVPHARALADQVRR